MKPCVLIPCFEHIETVAHVAASARSHAPVIVVDDGSTRPLPPLPHCELIRLEKNSGKGAALRAGFQRAAKLGFSHAITMDADGQHFAQDVPKFVAASADNDSALIVGVRNFRASGAPAARRRTNRVSTFWYRVETGIKLTDTQCGFRCYPLELTSRLNIGSGHYAFEYEFLVRAAWAGAPILPVPVQCEYREAQVRESHFHPVLDVAHISLMNVGLAIQSLFVPRPVNSTGADQRLQRPESSTERARTR